MARRLPGRLWFRDKVSGIEWQHRLVSNTTMCRLSDDQEVYALTMEAHRAVYYLDSEPMDVLKHLYLHELKHRIGLSPGSIDHLMSIYGTTDYDIFSEREERHTSFFAGPMAEACGQFLKLPRKPK